MLNFNFKNICCKILDLKIKWNLFQNISKTLKFQNLCLFCYWAPVFAELAALASFFIKNIFKSKFLTHAATWRQKLDSNISQLQLSRGRIHNTSSFSL
jgi:hypothetical protein